MSDALAERAEFNKWVESRTGWFFSPGAESSNFYYAIWCAGRDSVRQREAIGSHSAIPREPTVAMLRAGDAAKRRIGESADTILPRIWTAMYDATQQQQTGD